MVRISLELLRRRAEHNEGMVSTLEEVTLHQFEIEKIEFLEQYCRHLRILYLQNNVIGRMEGLNKLKELDYLNLALNNVSVIEGIDRCESLRKLDLTLNFIDLEDLEASMLHLRRVDSIRILHLTGNPCSDWKQGYRKYVVAMVPQLEDLDGTEVTATERLEALQELDSLAEELRELAAVNVERKANMTEEEKKAAYSKEYRVEMAREMEKEREDTEKKRLGDEYAPKTREITPVLNHKGEIRQCNEGKYDFSIYEKVEKGQQIVILEVFVPRFLDTSMLNVDINPDYVRVEIRQKVFQLRLMCDVRVEESRVLRSSTTGALQLLMPKVKNSIVPYYNVREEDMPVKPGKQQETPVLASVAAPKAQRKQLEEPEFVDDSEVPPLE
jgi:protein TilB